MTTLDVLSSTELNVDHETLAYRAYTLKGLRAAGLPEAVILAAAKASLKTQVDTQAETLRSKVLTPGAGQALEYQEAQAQAVAATTGPSAATPALFPMLAASIGVDIDPQTSAPAVDVLGVARSIIAAHASWAAIGASIREARLKGKAAIEAATSIEAAAAAFDAIDWPPLAP